MTNGPFDDPHLDATWRVYADQERQLAPRPQLEQLVLARCLAEGARGAGATGQTEARRGLVFALAAAASFVLLVIVSQSSPTTAGEPSPLAARGMAATVYRAPVAAEPPQVAAAPLPRRAPAASMDAYVQHVELPASLMLFDAGPLQLNEPLQMVRLRLPREALQALGLALLEPDAGGVVDVDVLVGEDGLPRDIRQVRIGREQR
jgi:hypothetical protein